MPPKSIRDVFEEQCGHVTFDRARYAIACNLQEGFVNRQSEHIAFFGGALTGVHRVRFIDSDRDKLFDLLLEADEHDLRTEIYALRYDNGEPVIRQNFIVSRDIFNISSIWLIHKFATSPHLTQEQREDAKVRIAMYLLYKFLTSLLSHYYHYPAEIGLAQATYDALNLKFSLRKCGNWGDTIRELAIMLVSEEGGGYKAQVIKSMDVDYDVVRMINDMQGRIRDYLKNITEVFYQVKARGERVGSVIALQDIDGELELRDKTDNLAKHTQYVKRVMSDANSYVRDELVNVVTHMMRTVSPRTFYQTLSWTSLQYHGQHGKQIDQCIDLVMEHAFDYLTSHRDISHNDIGTMLERLRGAYMSSRSTDERLRVARTEVQKIMALATGSTNENLLASARTAWMLYLVARAFTMRHYTNS